MSKVTTALNIEIALHETVLFVLVLPVYCLAVPQYFLMRSTVDGYAAARIGINKLFRQDLPPVQALLFSGHIVERISSVALAVILSVAILLFMRRTRFRIEGGQTASPPYIDTRRYRTIPSRYQSDLTAFLRELWNIANAPGEPPSLYCFVATSVVACAFSDGGRPAIAISTGMIERWSKGDDVVARVILLHEIGHIIAGDERKLPRGEALVVTVRDCMYALIGCGALFSLSRAPLEAFGVDGNAATDIPFAAYTRGVVMPSLFALLGVVVVARYVSLITMLTELRADLSAATSLGGVQHFTRVVERETPVNASAWSTRWKSLLGVKVTHLSPVERLLFLKDSRLLVMPKLRYFLLSFALPVLLLFMGRSGFIASSANASLGFQWVISAGLTGAVIVIHLAIFLLLYNAEQVAGLKTSLLTLIRLAAILIGSGYILLINEYQLINRIDEWITGLLMPEFSGSWADQIHRLGAIATVILAPLRETQSFAIPELWFIVTYTFLWSFSRKATWMPRRWIFPIVSATLVVGLISERVFMDDLPGYSIRRLMPVADAWIGSRVAIELGPLKGLIPLAVALVIAAAGFVFTHYRSSSRALDQSLVGSSSPNSNSSET